MDGVCIREEQMRAARVSGQGELMTGPVFPDPSGRQFLAMQKF